MPEGPKPLKFKSAPNLENDKGNEKIREFIALAKELGESKESFPFPGIEPEARSKMKATDMEFPDYTTPVDILVDRFHAEGMKVVLGQYPESGNVFIVPAGTSNPVNEDMYISPKHLQINEMISPNIRRLILMDKSGL